MNKNQINNSNNISQKQGQAQANQMKFNALVQEMRSRVYTSEYMFVKASSTNFGDKVKDFQTNLEIDWVAFAKLCGSTPGSEQFVEVIQHLVKIDQKLLDQLVTTLITFSGKAAKANVDAHAKAVKEACDKLNILIE